MFTGFPALRISRLDEWAELHDRIQTPLPVSTRVGFLGLTSGLGCSVAGSLAVSVLAHRRKTGVLAVNASGTQRSLLWHVGLTSTVPPVPVENLGARTSAEATANLPTTAAGVTCTDFGRLPAQRWAGSVSPIGRFFDFVVTDWGIRVGSELAEISRLSHLVVITTSCERRDLQSAVNLAERFRQDRTPAVLVVSEATGRRPTGFRLVQARLPFPNVLIPSDRAHRAGSPAPSKVLRRVSNLAATRLAATLVSMADPAPRPRRSA